MGTRRALVVANDDYADTGLQSLRSPATDAAALADVLGDPDIGGFTLSVVRNASVQSLREELDRFFGSAARDDELLVHFSCHGLKDDANDLYLAAVDTRPGLLASTGLPADFVARRMRASRARSVALLLDCCYGGAFERGMLARAGGDVAVLDSFGQGQLAEGSGRVVITASSAVEYAFEGSDLTDDGTLAPSVFTSAVVEGIATGEADSDGTGTINIHELFSYAEEHVRRANPRQTPHLWSFGTHGNILVARSPLRRVVPAALPVAVQTALAGDRISRLGAVHELAVLLEDANPSVVLAAVQALGFLVGDDSRSLSLAASTALAGVRLTASPASVEIAAGEQAEVVLGGSGLAVAARVTAAPEWLKARQVGNRLLIVASPDSTSTGTITVDGPTGSATVTVTATVLPAETTPAPAEPSEPEPPAVTPPIEPPQAEASEPEPPAVTPPVEPAPEPPAVTPPVAATPEPATPVTRIPGRSRQALWATAAGLLLLCLAIPMDGEDGDWIWIGDYAGDFSPGRAAFWTVSIILAAALLITAAVRWPTNRKSAQVAGGAGAVLAAVSGVLAIVAAVEDDPAVGTFIAVLAALLAIVATVTAFGAPAVQPVEGTAPPSSDRVTAARVLWAIAGLSLLITLIASPGDGGAGAILVALLVAVTAVVMMCAAWWLPGHPRRGLRAGLVTTAITAVLALVIIVAVAVEGGSALVAVPVVAAILAVIGSVLAWRSARP